MQLQYIPLLQQQRDLQAIPRGYERFEQYIRTITTDDRTGLQLAPLVAMNPMGKDHVTALLDTLLAMDADAIAARAAADAAIALGDSPDVFKVGLVVSDDLMGGWTNRYAAEYSLRFPDRSLSKPKPRWLKDEWLTAILWGSEPASERAVREAVLTSIHRMAYRQAHGNARTLREKMAQEGCVMAHAECAGPLLDDEDIAYTREVLTPFLDADDMRTAIECLFGDAAGQTLGFTPRGLSPWAGLALALREAKEVNRQP